MFEHGTDGSAIAFQIPISPFVPLHHNTIDVSTINRLANFGLRFAMEHGWCRATPKRKTGNKAYEGLVDEDNDVTVLYAGMDAELREKNLCHVEGVPASMLFWGQFWVSYMGTSSFGIYGKLFRYEVHDENNKDFIGEFRLTGVAISKSMRTPVPLPSERRILFEQAVVKHNATTPFSRVERIHVMDILRCSGLFKDDTCSQCTEALPTHPSVAPLTVGYRRTFMLRETDIDFNKHVNQMAMIQLMINTFRSALGDTSTVFPRLLDQGMEPLFGDLLIRRLRIDYVREIPFSGNSGVTVTLFFHDESSRDSVISSSVGNRLNVLNEIWVAAHGLPSDDSCPFVAAVGKLFVSS